MSPPTSNRSKPQGRQEIVPEWFNERNEDNSESRATSQNTDFEAERQKILERLERAKENAK